jgi:hypothetical protein
MYGPEQGLIRLSLGIATAWLVVAQTEKDSEPGG